MPQLLPLKEGIGYYQPLLPFCFHEHKNTWQERNKTFGRKWIEYNKCRRFPIGDKEAENQDAFDLTKL